VAGKLAGAGLDVFEQEPPPSGHSLFELPHRSSWHRNVAAVTRGSGRPDERADARNILSALDGGTDPPERINQDVLRP